LQNTKYSFLALIIAVYILKIHIIYDYFSIITCLVNGIERSYIYLAF
jgi:hypothetical protein